MDWGIHPLLPVRLARDLFCVLAPLAALPCHACESARVGPAMQVINADDVGGLFQWLSLSQLAGGWYMWGALKGQRFVSLMGAAGSGNVWVFLSLGMMIHYVVRHTAPHLKKQSFFFGQET